MINTKTWLRLIVPLAFTLAAGCAPAYHNYSGCYVDCHYCPPPPLPYAQYNECVCHSCPVQPYLHAVAVAVEEPQQATVREADQPPEPDKTE